MNDDTQRIGIETSLFSSIENDSYFVPSIDLVQAVLRQRDFLEKFQGHRLYSHKFTENDPPDFDQLVQNYVSFLKLARNNEMIVPTFDIDLIWHSHMRHPRHYQACCIALCGFVLNHNDSIEKDILAENYRKTADQWKQAYNIDYGRNINREKIQSTQTSGCGTCFSYHEFRFSDIFQSDSESTCSGGDGGGCGGCGGD